MRLPGRAGGPRARSHLVPAARGGRGARLRRGPVPTRPVLRRAGQGARRIHRLQKLSRKVGGERGHLVLDRVRIVFLMLL